VLKTPCSTLLLYDLDSNWTRTLSSRSLLQSLDTLLVHRPPITVFGRICQQKRSVAFFSDTSSGYAYSGQVTRALSFDQVDWMKRLLDYVNQKFNANFNGVLVNKYQDGEEYMAKHADDEKEIDDTAGVVMISIGAIRKFRIRDKKTGKIKMDVLTHPGKIMQMKGDFQKEFLHEIPVEKTVKSARYSFTFRRHI
jgi:alkylated DNA repair dioxygenase AlkB